MQHAPHLPTAKEGTTQSAGQSMDDNKGRIFPCDQCGADLVFDIGVQQMKCPYCGDVKQIELPPDQNVLEQDFHAMIQRLAELRLKGVTQEAHTQEIRCEACGGTAIFTGTLTSSECPYCATPIQRENIHDSPERVPVDGVLPFRVNHDTAQVNLVHWVNSRWFAPNSFRKKGVKGKFNGVYLPFWTFDSLTFNRYHGERGDHYYVEVKRGDQTVRERRTRWSPASGSFKKFFDDVMVVASQGLPKDHILALEPWPLSECVPFNQQMLAGFLARTYDLELEPGFNEAKVRMDAAIHSETRQRIGGDEQRVHSLDSHYSAITFKHLLLPTWMMAYQFHEKAYQVMVNAVTGEVQGERPYSWVKITFAVLLAIALIGGIVALSQK
jgi:hypothetical protein